LRQPAEPQCVDLFEVVLVVTTGWMTHHSGLLSFAKLALNLPCLRVLNRILTSDSGGS
jgi:hypothetical protein